MKPLENREVAGQFLSKLLQTSIRRADTVVLALPRGGVPIAWEISKELALPWDILLVKKIAAPHQPEFAIGAISEDDEPLWDQKTITALNISKIELIELSNQTRKKVSDQMGKWRRGRHSIDYQDKNIILVDDGLATGLTMIAAIQYLRKKRVKRITVAVPVSSQSSFETIKNMVDDIIVLFTPEPFFSVGQWYEDFSQVEDEEVTNMLVRDLHPEKVIQSVQIPAQGVVLQGDLYIPKHPKGVVVFVHGSGSSHKSPRHQKVAQSLMNLGYASLLFDLLTSHEEQDRKNVFNIELLSQRLSLATNWVRKYQGLQNLSLGYFGASTGAAAALLSASKDKTIATVISRGGRPDLAMPETEKVECPVLLLVGSLDHGVIDLNQKALATLDNGQMILIPNAGHLFEEPGTLDEVIEYSSEWFTKTLFENTTRPMIKPKKLIIEDIKKLAHPMKEGKSLTPLLQKLSRSKIVMLGEATHGTEEFYQIRKMITERLIKEYGFSFVAVEGDWPDCYKLNQYIHSSEKSTALHAIANFNRWPTWMWANEQILELVEWMHGLKASFYGLDVYSLYQSLDLVKSYLSKIDKKLSLRLLEAYSCLESFEKNEIAYAQSLVRWPDGCEKQVQESLREVLRLRLENTKLENYELFNFQQNAKVIANAEKYYRTMVYGGPESWNNRDQHMMDTLDSLLKFHGENSKAIVWAHNSHIGDYHATDMVSDGYVNLGGLARERYGMEAVSLVGFGTYEGEVLAGKAWDAKPEIMKIPPAKVGSYEHFFHEATKELHYDDFYLMMNQEPSFMQKRGHRAIGVVYQTIFENHGKNYVPTELAKRYDSFVFVNKTTALRPLATLIQKGMLPETWPVGF